VTRIAYLDLIGGVAGDMLMAALIDAGADAEALYRSLATLGLEHRSPQASVVARGGIRALHLNGTPLTGQESRTLADITAILEAGDLADAVKARAVGVFQRLVEAEARAHGQPPETIRLHEAGDDDAIFDVVGVILAIDDLGIEEVISSPVPLGGGRDATGMPWPGPATLELLRGLPVTGPPLESEATTPTGAALVATLATSFGMAPSMTLDRVGYGAGTRDLPGTPNLLRVLVGERIVEPWVVQHGVRVIEANIDDLTPQLVADAAEALLGAGALDVWQTPIQMKHGRLAVTLSALADASAVAAIKATFFRATTTLGVREYAVERAVLERDVRVVEIRGESVRVKLGRLGGAVTTSMPEHADLERLADRTGIPVRQLWQEAIAATGSPPGADDR
jgi:pyridinium-3,5-bisthiocarboxylic acid mononucleotide nickel chelatase